jgi:hypothetical protein
MKLNVIWFDFVQLIDFLVHISIPLMMNIRELVVVEVVVVVVMESVVEVKHQ